MDPDGSRILALNACLILLNYQHIQRPIIAGGTKGRERFYLGQLRSISTSIGL